MPPFEILTFDCYGTLIDWERGMRESLAGLVKSKGLPLGVDAMHDRYSEIERELQGSFYRRYREVLRIGVETAFGEQGVGLTWSESNVLADTLPTWPVFPDTTEVLGQLKDKGCKLVILSNIDDDLVRRSVEVLGVEFDGVITAQQVGSYKPAHNHWNRMLEELGVAKERVLHVAQSYFHDVVPAKEMGYTMAWINRKGETPAGEARPDYEFPDLRGLLAIL